MSATAVVHLMRGSEGPEPFKAFMDSYERHDAGLPHELVLVFKGVDASGVEHVRRRLDGRSALELHLPDIGPDVATYMEAARRLPHDRLCLLNAWTHLTSPGWLRLLSSALDAPGVGAAGATCSWASARSLALWNLRLPSAYRRVLTARGAVRESLPPARAEELVSVWGGRLKALRDAPLKVATHPSFPAPHLRTNGFVIDRRRWLSLHTGRQDTKLDSHRFECGRPSMTNQLAARGLRVLAVGCDGRSWTAEQWPDAELFWQGAQRDLLMTDNQTRTYAQAPPAGRDLLSRLSWGERARPG